MSKKKIIVAAVMVLILTVLFFNSYQPDIPIRILTEKYATGSSQFVSVQGMSVHYRDEGPRSDNVPLVLLHGTSSSLLTWDGCAQQWATVHRVLRMDLPGFGLTGPNPQNDYSIDSYVSFLAAFLQELDVEQCYLAGNSLGGLIAYQFAARYPNQVKKIILIDPAGYPNGHAKGSLAFTLGKIPVLRNLLTVLTPKSIVRKSLEDVYGDKSLVTDALVDQYYDLACREGNREALLTRLNLDQKGDTTLVSKVNLPALIIWGSLDQLIPVANAYKFQRDLPNDSLVILPGVGHVPMEERPEKVIPLVLSFIR